jgi:hypothetical protein
LTRVSDRNPLRRLLVISKGLLAVVPVLPHRHTLRSRVSGRFRTPAARAGSRVSADANAPAAIHPCRYPAVTSRDARIQKWAFIAFAVVEAIVIGAVLWMRTRGG